MITRPEVRAEYATRIVVRTLDIKPGHVIFIVYTGAAVVQEYLSPADARALAAHLVAVADEVEA